MGTITIKFKNLCAFFTKNVTTEKELMVGLLDLSDFYDVPEKDWHTPKITIDTKKSVINPNGEEVLVNQTFSYEGFPGRCCGHLHGDLTRLISGDIRLEVLAEMANLTVDESANSILDFENTLYPEEALESDPLLCKARFHFRNGTLSGVELDDVNFATTEDPVTSVSDGVFAIEAELRVAVPEPGYAVLRFLNSDTADFVFLGENDYEVTIDNAPPLHEAHTEAEHEGETESHPNHFKYYHKLMRHPPAQQLAPIEDAGNPASDDPFCMIGGFGKSNFPSAFSD
ncbi:MAG TPA: hypothetical protein VJ810_15925 [Blastocatellia bacterium]|nr:hypothetical protein [Blastocatellia bacterium]